MFKCLNCYNKRYDTCSTSVSVYTTVTIKHASTRLYTSDVGNNIRSGESFIYALCISIFSTIQCFATDTL